MKDYKTKILSGEKMKLTNEVVYILVQRLNSENKGEVDKDIIMSVYKTEASAIQARNSAEKYDKEFGFGKDVYEVKACRLWE